VRNLYSNHGLVLTRIWIDPEATLSEIAGDIGIKERAVYLIVRDLANEGLIVKEKVGRRNRYHVNVEQALDFQPLPNISIRQGIMTMARAMGMRFPEGEPTRR
jgi:DNA-binding MarR family transcriptional regulator